MIFVDTSGWIATYYPKDAMHEPALQWFRSNHNALVTTDYVIDETLTLAMQRDQQLTIPMGKRLFSEALTDIVHVGRDDVEEAWQLLQQHQDKRWSFTDCTSYVIMRRLGIEMAFSFDSDFRQFGIVTTVPMLDT